MQSMRTIVEIIFHQNNHAVAASGVALGGEYKAIVSFVINQPSIIGFRLWPSWTPAVKRKTASELFVVSLVRGPSTGS